MTELGLDFVARQVPAEPDVRAALMLATATKAIPVLVADDGELLEGEDEIMSWLDRFHERDDADLHREKARREVPEFAA